MPSFDVVSEVDMQEVRNAADQANREVGQRFDFKGSDAHFELKDEKVLLEAESEFQLNQMMDILEKKLVKRRVDISVIQLSEPEVSNKRARQTADIQQGIDADSARKMVKDIKQAKLKVQAQVQGEQVRVSGKKRDDLQAAISLLKGESYDMPLQYTNFRD